MRCLRVLSILCCVGTLLPEGAIAQSVGGALRGSVVVDSGVAVAGVSLTVTSPVLQGERVATSDSRGGFQFPSLPAGTYSILLRRIGYTPLRMNDVSVHLGFTTSVGALRLARQTTQLDEVVVVSGARAVLDVTSAASRVVLDSAQFRSLPTSRDFHSLLALVPQGNPSPYGDGVSFGGATGYDNKFFIDGIHASNPLSSDGGIRLPYNFIREVQVTSGGYEAEFGRSQGAVVNVVTNSGGNELRGEAVAFMTGKQLRTTPRWGLAERPVEEFSHYDVGLSIGGPIKRDRMWFYAAYNPLFEEKDVSFTGIATERDRLVRHLFASKLTWRPARETDVSLTVLGDPTTRDAVEGAEAWTAPLATVTDPRVVRGGYRDGGWATSLQLRQRASPRILLTGVLSHLTNVHQVAHRSGADDDVSLARIDDYIANVSYGDFGRSYRVNTTRTAVEGTLTYLAPNHTVKVGANFERNAIHLPVFAQSFVGRNPDGSWSWFTGYWAGRGHSTVPALYVQDSWEVSPRLRANVGLRWEGQFVAGDTGKGMRIDDEFSPRVGLVFQPGTSGNHKLFASAGRFYEQLPLWSVSALTMPFSMRIGFYPQNPLVSRAGGNELDVTLGSIVAADKDLHGQYYDELTAGYERRVGNDFRLSVQGTLRALGMALESDSTTRDPANPSYTMLGLLGNPGRGALAQLPRGTRRYSGIEVSVHRTGAGPLTFLASYVLSRAFGNLNGEFDSDSRVPATHTQGQTGSPNWWEHATGYLPSDRRHLLKFSGSYRLRENLTAGVASMFGTGLPLSEFAGDPPFSIIHVRQRGTSGRTPSTLNVDLRFTYEANVANARWRPRFTLDVYNLANRRQAIDFEQLHYFDNDPSRANSNPNYLKVNRYQPPLSARIGVVLGF